MTSRTDLPKLDRSIHPRDRGITASRERDPNSPNAVVNELTLQEHQDYLTWVLGQRRLDRNEAESVGHRPNEIEAYFGPDKPREPTVAEERKLASNSAGATVTLSRDGFHRVAPTTIAAEKPTGFDRLRARTMGFTGDVCLSCGSTRMVRNGSCLICQECGQTTGCT
jgi:ribonucleoside-diphosphate reductase alpha chain